MRLSIDGPERAIHRNPLVLRQNGARLRVWLSAPGAEPADSGDALVDSGSRISAVDALIVARLDLAFVGEARVAGIGGVLSAKTHLVNVRCGDHDFGDLTCAAIEGLAARGFVAILGRDVLFHRSFSYDGCRGVFRVRENRGDACAGHTLVPEDISALHR